MGKYKDNKDLILLFALGTHIGYVLLEYPTITKTNRIITNYDSEIKQLYSYIQLDCEFDLNKTNDSYTSGEPNLIVMKCMVKHKDSFMEKTIVKSGFKMTLNYLINLSNKD